MNKVILCGRLTTDVEVEKSKKTSYARFNLAVQRDSENTDFIPRHPSCAKPR